MVSLVRSCPNCGAAMCAVAGPLEVEVNQLHRVIRWYFSYEPDHVNQAISDIGACILVMPEDIRETIIRECKAAEAAGDG